MLRISLIETGHLNLKERLEEDNEVIPLSTQVLKCKIKCKQAKMRNHLACFRNSKELSMVEIRRMKDYGKKWKEIKSEGQEVIFLSTL